jgi:hypothetical protein
MSDIRAVVRDADLDAGAEGTFMALTATKRGEVFIQSFYERMMTQGRCFNVLNGTISAPEVGDVVITDTAAEMATSARLGITIIPTFTNVNFNLAGGTLFESAGKSVGTIHTAGTAFVALPLKIGGNAAVSYSTVSSAGGVAVAAELATTTRRHWSWSQPITAGVWTTTYEYKPQIPAVLVGPACYYVQIAGTTTGPSYFSNYDFIELPSSLV